MLPSRRLGPNPGNRSREIRINLRSLREAVADWAVANWEAGPATGRFPPGLALLDIAVLLEFQCRSINSLSALISPRFHCI